jgi:uncharacterized protein YndB with AHSA1/START domain
MAKAKNILEVKVERAIPAPPAQVYDAWLDRKVPGTPWNMGEKLILNPKADGLFYWLVDGNAHFGRFTKVERPRRVQHTWMSRYTWGEETTVTVTFKKEGDGTRMILVHGGLPDDERGRAHEEGWNQFLDAFPEYFRKPGRGKRKAGAGKVPSGRQAS